MRRLFLGGDDADFNELLLSQQYQDVLLSFALTEPRRWIACFQSQSINTVFMRPIEKSRAVQTEGFTLLELLVVLGVIAVLVAIQLPALAAGKSQSMIGMCASHITGN